MCVRNGQSWWIYLGLMNWSLRWIESAGPRSGDCGWDQGEFPGSGGTSSPSSRVTTPGPLPAGESETRANPPGQLEPGTLPGSMVPQGESSRWDLISGMLKAGAMLTRGEVAAFLRVSPRTVQRLDASGRLRRCPGFGSLVRYASSDVLRLASAQRKER
jgi:hypothetical protein